MAAPPAFPASPFHPPAEPERRYFGKVADATPDDTLLLTLGCGE